MPRFVAAVLACVVASGLACCSGSGSGTVVHGCTAVGCTSGAAIDFSSFRQVPGDEVYTSTVCIDSTCHTNTRQGPSNLVGAFVTAAYNRKNAVTVSIVLRDAAGRVLVSDHVPAEVTRVEPNGHGCAPVCYQAELMLDAGGKLHVVPPPS